MTDFQPDDLAITTRQVMVEGWAILLVTHDADDGAWQFVNGRGDTDATESAMVVGVNRVVRVDPSLVELADLRWVGKGGADGRGRVEARAR